MPRLVVVSGRSGSGKTSALNILEDVGFDCIDNLPPSLLPDLIKQLNSERINEDLRLAVGIDARNLVGDLNKLPDILAGLEASGIEVSVIFLQARRSDLIRRYSETRRKHPLSNETVSLPEAIDLEAKILSPILNISDRNIDTSGLSLHQLRDLVKNTIVPNSPEHMALLFEFLGLITALPEASDFIFDVRCTPTPDLKQELRIFTAVSDTHLTLLTLCPLPRVVVASLRLY